MQRGFSRSTISQDSLEEYRREANPSREFLNEFLIYDPNSQILAADVFRIYKKWSVDNDHRTLDAAQFGREIRKIFTHVERVKLGAKENREYFLRGLAWTTEEVCGNTTQNFEI
jgi:phage/plasmid-associated DNA primase